MANHPNILWIYCDELRADAVGCWAAGTMRVPTPNLDRLAGQGVRFDNCFCNSPVCVPSRVSTLTACPPERTGVYNNEGAWPNFQLPRPVLTFPEHFAAAGYTTADFGKMHLPRSMKPWQHQNPQGGGMAEISKHMPPPVPENSLGGRFPAGIPYPAEKVTDNALAFLDQVTGPFLMRVSYLQPHTPLLPPPPYDTMFDDLTFHDIPDDKKRLSVCEQRWSDIWRARGYTEEQLNRARGYYCGLVAWVDSQVGRLLDDLERRGTLDSTIIAFAADHGTSKGEGGCGEKHIYAPWVHRVPLIISHPAGGLSRGQARNDLAQNMDLARTFCHLAGVNPAESFEGRSLFSNPEPYTIFSTVGFGFEDSRAAPNGQTGDWPDGRGWPRRSCVRTRTHRLDMNIRLHGQIPITDADMDIFLADLTTDPQEVWNVAAEPANGPTVMDLAARLLHHTRNSVEVPHAYVRHLRHNKSN